MDGAGTVPRFDNEEPRSSSVAGSLEPVMMWNCCVSFTSSHRALGGTDGTTTIAPATRISSLEW